MSGLAARGGLGVDLFFGISGFLITTLLLREHTRHGVVSLRKFYGRRALRIFPLYYTVLGLYIIAMPFGAHETAEGFRRDLPYFLSYTSNWFTGRTGYFIFAWSLAAEEQFYSTWPWALRYLGPGRAMWLPIGMLPLLVVWQWSLPQSGPHTSLAGIILDNVPIGIVSGCLVAFALNSATGFRWAWLALGGRWTQVILLGAVLGLAAIGPFSMVESILLAALVGACVVREDGVLAPALQHRWAVLIGVVSYGIYMLHELVYSTANVMSGVLLEGKWHVRTVSGFLAVSAVTTLLATVSFRYYESTFLRLKSRFRV
jgi:peptidoglycan/LPS O-acetylase OafA/YrhL